MFGLCDFGGECVDVVQVGLGTNSTFLQNVGGCSYEWNYYIDKMLQMIRPLGCLPSSITGIAVEPVQEHVSRLCELVPSVFPRVALCQFALGSKSDSSAHVHVLSEFIIQQTLEHVSDVDKVVKLRMDLEYLQNMSCVGELLPGIRLKLAEISAEIGCSVHFEQRHTSVLTWSEFARLLNFNGCKLLLIDTEGHDCKVLRSLLEHGMHDGFNWPYVIQFESMGWCDEAEGPGTEDNIIQALREVGYVLLAHSGHSTILAFGSALKHCEMVSTWAINTFYCEDCWAQEFFPYFSYGSFFYCDYCCRNWYTQFHSESRSVFTCLVENDPGDQVPCFKRQKLI